MGTPCRVYKSSNRATFHRSPGASSSDMDDHRDVILLVDGIYDNSLVNIVANAIERGQDRDPVPRTVVRMRRMGETSGGTQGL